MKTILACLACSLWFHGGSAATYYNSFDSIKGIENSLSFNGQIQASTNGSNTLQIDAPQNVLDVLDIKNSSSGILTIGFKSGTSITIPSGVTTQFSIGIAEGKLTSYDQSGAGKVTADGDVFSTTDEISIVLAGSASFIATNVSTSNFEITQSGSGYVVIKGSPGSIDLQSRGSGSSYFIGVTKSVKVDMAGSGNAYVNGSGNPTITGRAIGSANVYYSGAQCSVTSIGSGSVCQQIGSIPLPN